jgi:predicted nucleic acid-binding Zn ribbon protein
MEITSILIGLFLFGVALFFVSAPFRQKGQGSKTGASNNTLQDGGREATLSALRDLDFDFRTGKVSEEDYQPLRAQLLAEAARYLESEEKEEQQLEELIRARRAGQQGALKCEHCDAPIQADQRFCARCGAAVKNALCPSCGKKIQPGDLFCSSCGHKIQIQLEVATQS